MIEKQVLHKALKEPNFAKEVFSKLPSSSFKERDEYKELFIVIKRYYKTNSKALDENTLLTLVENSLTRRKASTDTIDKFFDTVTDLYTVGAVERNEEVISEQIQRYVRKVLSSHLIMETVKNNNLDDEGVVENLSDELKKIAILDASGTSGTLFDFFGDVEAKRSLYKNMRQNRFSTGFDSIDKVADGGLARGELGLVLASTGGGKSTWVVQQTTNYVKRGMNVLYVVLEEKLDRMVFKLEQNFVGVSKQNFMMDDGETLNDEMFDAVQELYKQTSTLGELYIDKHNPQEVTIGMLEQIIVDASIRKGVTLDAVIIDYPDLMKNHHEQFGSESEAGGKLYEDIRGLAGKYQFVCWVLSQLNRSGWGQEIRTADTIEGSKRKLNAVELAFTLNQTATEFKEGFIRIHIDKLRYSTGGGYDKIQHFKVVPEGYVIRDETEEELHYHKSLLNDEDSGRPPQSPKNNYSEATNKVNKINALI